jgi:hypothetical protein
MVYSHASLFLIFIAGIIIVTSILPIVISTTYGQKAPSTTTTTTTQKDPSCNNLYSGPNLWSHVYGVAGSNPRLTAKSPDCITATGTVLSISKPGTPGADADGDYHFNIITDPSTPNYSNSYNCKIQPAGGCRELIAEIICYDHSSAVMTLPAAQTSCSNYQNHIKGPQANDHVTVTGKWVKDVGVSGDYHYWNEIHPVTKICIDQTSPKKPICY